MTELEIARSAAEAAGEVLMDFWNKGFTSREKTNAGFVTDADLAAETTIVNAIRAQRPDHEILGEEEHDADLSAEHLWIVDPLDGTTNFAHGLPHFAVSIAYYHRGQPHCGVIINPARNDRFETTAGGGAFHNGERVQVSEAESLDQVLVGVGFYYDRGAMMQATLAAIADLFGQHIHGIRRFGTASLDMCHVACGLYGGFFEYQLSPWDYAAGRLFVEEAGGTVTTCTGDPLPLEKTHLLATNTRLHPAILEIVARHCPG